MVASISSDVSNPAAAPDGSGSGQLDMLQALLAELEARETTLTSQFNDLSASASLYSGLATTARGEATVEKRRADDDEPPDEDDAAPAPRASGNAARSASMYSMAQGSAATQMTASSAELGKVQSQIVSVKAEIAALG